ncbi:MAG: PilN domain-containing protein [Jaaginema sp. PMC 1079.18]|nr:PilN domain-containing protein [Jaaginema sp. PMC 1080.18]MEC4851110.1 PilN domain-containing protein [Jaaginema sp. PMC 1079.18]MEC4867376.1 PilN domain-containing protein [Jaaginema sp. PMC 1078.18]
MYGLDINFLKDRAEPIAAPAQRKAASLPASAMIPMFAGLAVGLLLPGLVGGFWLWVNWRTTEAQEELADKSNTLSTLQAETAEVEQLKQEIELAQTQTNALVNVFTEIRSWSAILQDVRDRVPEGVTISGISQEDVEVTESTAPTPPPAGQEQAAPVVPQRLVVGGFAQSFSDVNDFMLTLKNSDFFVPDNTAVVSSQLVDYPISEKPQNIELPQVVEFSIHAQLADIPDDRLLSLLERKGAFGLAERLRTARNFQQEGETTQ